MNCVIVTGSSKLPPADRPRMERILNGVVESHTSVIGWVTGGQRGIDVLALAAALRYHPHAYHDVWLPARPYDRQAVQAYAAAHAAAVAKAGGRITFHHCLPGTDYRYRNLCMLQQGYDTYGDGAEVLAFPCWPEEHPMSTRSGTWLCTRQAATAGIPVTVVPLWHVP